MHRLLASTESIMCGAPDLSPEARNHLKVLRPRESEKIELFDGAGLTRVFSWKGGALAPSGEAVRHARSPLAPVLFACVTKGQRWDWTLQKAVELGASRIVPVISARTIVRIPACERGAKRERWMRIAEEAARQSDSAWIPEICEPVDFSSALSLAAQTKCFAGALTDPPSEPLAGVVAKWLESRSDDTPPSLFVGPEGDFTPEELASLLEIATPSNFGDSVLRAETAAIFGIAVIGALVKASERLPLRR